MRAVKESGIYENTDDLTPSGGDSMKDPNRDESNVTKVTGGRLRSGSHERW